MLSRTARSAACVLVAIASASCGEQAPPTSHESLHGDLVRSSGDVAPDLGHRVRAATSRFHSKEQALKAGYAEASPCVTHPTLGGMGFHWVKDPIVDPVFDPLQPEALVYAPDKNGKQKLAAVEYIVIDVGQPAPTFAGHAFDVGGTPVPVPHWSLHVWLYRPNPSGIFSPWNPTVSCAS